MIETHVCETCCAPSYDHDALCDPCTGEGERVFHWPVLCCPGCPCRSFEDAHPRLEAQRVAGTPVRAW